MRRAAYILSWFCVSAVIMPVALRAAADTNSRSGVVMAKSTAVSLPQAVRNTPPRSATLSNIQNYDPHPFITEFMGPATAPKAKRAAKKAKAKSAATKPLPQAQLAP
ncbi:MAG: hypothetical protein ABIP12_05780 [Terriglobales bacterium]